MKPFNFNDGSREQIRRDAQARARFHRWQAPGRARVEHPAHGSVVVPHASLNVPSFFLKTKCAIPFFICRFNDSTIMAFAPAINSLSVLFAMTAILVMV